MMSSLVVMDAIGSCANAQGPLGRAPCWSPSMAPKSGTPPIAITLAEEVGGVPTLTANLAIAGGS